MQAAAALNGEYNTSFLTTQLIANYGASLVCNVDREHTRYEVVLIFFLLKKLLFFIIPIIFY